MNLLTPLRRAVIVASSRTAIVGETSLTYAQWWQRCRKLAGMLAELGLRRGDRVAIAASNSYQYLELYQTVPGSGYVLVPIDPRQTTGEIRYTLKDSGATVLFTDLPKEQFSGMVDQPVSLPDDYEGLLASADDLEPPDDVNEDELAGLFYTGGTTGKPKGVMLTHRNIIANAYHFMACWPFRPETRWIIAVPLFHTAGTNAVLATVWNAGSHVLLPRFDAGRALDFIEHHRATSTLVVPTMMAAMADEQLARPRDVSSLTLLSFGGSPCATDVIQRAHQAFPDATMLHIYGTTETAPDISFLPHVETFMHNPRARSCGRPAVGVEVRITDPDGQALPPGEAGEVRVRGPNVMRGYWNKPEETRRAMDNDWYRTGDLAFMDGEGYIFHVDRSKDVVVTGGETVHSTEVENVLQDHPAVLEAAVFGIPDSKWGEAVHAVVVPQGQEAIETEELVAHCRQSLAGYKVPKSIDIRLDPLPKSGAGKVLKRELREPYWTGHKTRVGGG